MRIHTQTITFRMQIVIPSVEVEAVRVVDRVVPPDVLVVLALPRDVVTGHYMLLKKVE